MILTIFRFCDHEVLVLKRKIGLLENEGKRYLETLFIIILNKIEPNQIQTRFPKRRTIINIRTTNEPQVHISNTLADE